MKASRMIMDFPSFSFSLRKTQEVFFVFKKMEFAYSTLKGFRFSVESPTNAPTIETSGSHMHQIGTPLILRERWNPGGSFRDIACITLLAYDGIQILSIRNSYASRPWAILV